MALQLTFLKEGDLTISRINILLKEIIDRVLSKNEAQPKLTLSYKDITNTDLVNSKVDWVVDVNSKRLLIRLKDLDNQYKWYYTDLILLEE